MAIHAGRGRSHNRLRSKMAVKGGYASGGYPARGGGTSGGLAGNSGDGFHGGNHHNNRRGCQGDVKKDKNNKQKPPMIITDLANANGKFHITSGEFPTIRCMNTNADNSERTKLPTPPKTLPSDLPSSSSTSLDYLHSFGHSPDSNDSGKGHSLRHRRDSNSTLSSFYR